jgi:hypothetical protein
VGVGAGDGLGLGDGDGLGLGDADGDGVGLGDGPGGVTRAGAANVAQREPTRTASGSRTALDWAAVRPTVRDAVPVADVVTRYETTSVPGTAHDPRRRDTA